MVSEHFQAEGYTSMLVRLLPSLQTPHSTIFGAKRARTCIPFVAWEPIMSLMAESGLSLAQTGNAQFGGTDRD